MVGCFVPQVRHLQNPAAGIRLETPLRADPSFVALICLPPGGECRLFCGDQAGGSPRLIDGSGRLVEDWTPSGAPSWGKGRENHPAVPPIKPVMAAATSG